MNFLAHFLCHKLYYNYHLKEEAFSLLLSVGKENLHPLSLQTLYALIDITH